MIEELSEVMPLPIDWIGLAAWRTLPVFAIVGMGQVFMIRTHPISDADSLKAFVPSASAN